MSAIHGRSASILVNQFDLSNQLKSYNAQNSAPELECTGFQDLARVYISNFPEGSLGLEGYFHQDPTLLDGTDDVFQDLINDSSPSVVTVSPEGHTFGKRSLIVNGVETRVEVQSPADGYVAAMADFRGQVNSGVVLAALAAYTATGNGTSVDNGAASANGGVGHQHVTARSGTSPTNDTAIQHSVDDGVWVDLIVFSQKIAVGSERATVTGTVNRYTRARRTIGGTGSPSFTQLVSFARL